MTVKRSPGRGGHRSSVVRRWPPATQLQTKVSLSAYADGKGSVFIEVADHCGGLPPGAAEIIFRPFARSHEDKSGLGLGLSIARENVETAGGALSVRNVPGTGCVFTIRLPVYSGEA